MIGVNKEIEEIQGKITVINKGLVEFKTKKQQLRLKVSELRDPTLLAELTTFSQKKEELRENLHDMETKMKNTDTQIIDLLEPEKERTQKILKQHDKEEEKFKIEIKEIKEKIKGQDKQLKEREKQETEFRSEFRGIFNKRDKMNEEMQKDETKMIRKEEQIRGIEQRINTFSIDNARIKAELAALNEEFRQFEDIAIIKKTAKTMT